MATARASHAHPADFPPVVPSCCTSCSTPATRAGRPSSGGCSWDWSTERATRRPTDGEGDDADWLVLTHPDGRRALAVQEVEQLTASRWPEPGHPSVSHLDTTVPSRSALDAVHDLVLELGGELRLDRTDDPEEPLRAYASPEGHIFCVFVA